MPAAPLAKPGPHNPKGVSRPWPAHRRVGRLNRDGRQERLRAAHSVAASPVAKRPAEAYFSLYGSLTGHGTFKGAAGLIRLLLLLLSVPLAMPVAAEDRLAVFDEVANLVERRFHDPDLNGLDWKSVVSEHRTRVTPDMDREAFAAEVNALLARLETSHTRFVTKDSPVWHQLAGIFVRRSGQLSRTLAAHLTGGAPRYDGIGILTERRPEGTFVIGILDGHPAQKAGLLVGDRLISVEDAAFHPIRSFEGRSGQPVDVTVERRPGEIVTVSVTPDRLDGRTLFRKAMRDSARIVEKGGKRIGYIHAWSYAGDVFQEILSNAVLYGPLKNADALVLDVRDGWGGASPTYLHLFADQAMRFSTTRRDGRQTSFASAWDRPVVLLVNEGSRSGKELIAHGFRMLGKGPIVGERTAGAVVAGRLFPLSDGSLLYLAVADVTVDGKRLEGVGVAPDIEVPFDPAFAAGADPQLDRAVAVAADLAGS